MIGMKNLNSKKINSKKPCFFSYYTEDDIRLNMEDVKNILDVFINQNKLPMVRETANGTTEVYFDNAYNSCKSEFYFFLSRFISENKTAVVNDGHFLKYLCSLLYFNKSFDREVFDLLNEVVKETKNDKSKLNVLNDILMNCGKNEKFLKRLKTFVNEILNNNDDDKYHLLGLYIELFGNKIDKKTVGKIINVLIDYAHDYVNYMYDVNDEVFKNLKDVADIIKMINEKTNFDICSMSFRELKNINMLFILSTIYGFQCDTNSYLFDIKRWKGYMSPDFSFYILKLLIKNYDTNDKRVFMLVEHLFKNFVAVDEIDYEMLYEIIDDKSNANYLYEILRLLLEKRAIYCSEDLIRLLVKIERRTGNPVEDICPEYLIDYLLII